jgi:hypothetical protein
MDREILQAALTEMEQLIARGVANGFADLDEVLNYTLEIVADQYPVDALRPHAPRLLQQAIAAHLAQEKDWPAVTDCDRFDAAFEQLEIDGIVCRHNFSCCGTCAAGEIWTEIESERNKGREIIGCAHYNSQDTESAVEGYGLHLSYGSVLRGERPSVDIGHQIAAAMRARGLKVTWDGSLSRRIHVALDWKRRFNQDRYRTV